MLTPKQQLLFDRLKINPNFKTLVDRLNLEPTPSDAYRKSTMVAGRVAELIDQFEKASNLPAVKRMVIQTTPRSSGQDIFDLSAEINLYLISLYGPQPWKYPLPFAPF